MRGETREMVHTREKSDGTSICSTLTFFDSIHHDGVTLVSLID